MYVQYVVVLYCINSIRTTYRKISDRYSLGRTEMCWSSHYAVQFSFVPPSGSVSVVIWDGNNFKISSNSTPKITLPAESSDIP